MTNHYIRQGATGNNTGTDWTNAYTSLPSTLKRGDTYYIADGSYGSYTFDDPIDGTKIITIKKATISDHGTDVGWSDAYGDSQAIFASPFNISTSYVTFDGVVGYGSDYTSYGFRIATPTSCNSQNNTMFSFPAINVASISHVTVRHVALRNCNMENSGYDQRGFYSATTTSSPGATNMELSYSYVYGSSCNFLIRFWDGGIITHNFFDDNWSSSNFHGEQISPGGCKNIIFAYNTLRNSQTGGIGFHRLNYDTPSNNNWNVYNNIAYQTDSNNTISMGIFGNADTINEVTINSRFHHNTIANIINGGGYGSGIQFIDGNNTAYNNLFYNCLHPVVSTSGSHDYNTFYNCTGNIINETHIYQTTGNPFIDDTTANFHLNSETPNGLSLPAPYNIDYDGVMRGYDGTWDRGAFEYVSNGECPTPIVSFELNII